MHPIEYEARVFAATYPTPASHPNGGDGSWDQDCGRVMFRFGEWLGWVTPPRGDLTSAWRVALQSGPLNTDPAAAPVGAYHYFDIGGPENGHVMQQMDNNTLTFQGSAGVWEDVGVDIGFGSVAAYLEYRPTAVYLGWSRDYAGGVPIIPAAPAAVDQSPITPEDELMGAREEIIAEIRQAAEVARRESRPRLYEHETTGELMLVSIPHGFQMGPWDPKQHPGKLASLILNGYQLVTQQEADRRRRVDHTRWVNIQGEVSAQLARIAGAVADELDRRAEAGA